MATHEVARGGAEAKELRKLRKREARILEESRRRPDPWERYHVLVEVVDTSRRLIDLGDHKARFALVIMGFLNAALVVVGTRSEVVEAVPAGLRPWIAAALLPYTALVLGFLAYAIESLRPRHRRFLRDLLPGPAEATGGTEERPLGLLFWADTAEMELPALRRAWDEVRLGQINEELVLIAHGLAQINSAKYAALTRLYQCLRVMTALAVAVIMVAAFFFVHPGGQPDAPDPPSVPAPPAALLQAPERLGGGGIREPSGIAFHAGLGALFLVGDEGRLASLDTSAQPRWVERLPGDLEDLAVHRASGLLLLLSENPPELIGYDPVARRETGRFPLDSNAVLGQRPRARKQGFEGLVFREAPGRPGDGVLYLLHQRSPAMIVTLAFDPSRAPGRVGSESVVARWPLPGRGDLRAVTYVPSLDRLLVLCDGGRLLVIGTGGTVEGELGLEARRPEGLCLDGVGEPRVSDEVQGVLLFPDVAASLWVADEVRGVLRFPGALRRLEAQVYIRGPG